MTAVNAIQNAPVYGLSHLYISGLQLSAASTTVVAVAPGQARDSNNAIDMPVGFNNLQGLSYPAVAFQGYQPPLFINSAIVGVNGIDRGTIAASTQYAVYLIGDSRGYNQVGAVLSLTSNVAPTLPSGYDSYRLIGFFATDGSSHFVYATNKPQNMAGALAYYLSPSIAVLSGGTSATFAVIDLTTNSALPTTTLQNIIVTLQATFTPAAVGDTAAFRPTGSAATTYLPTITGVTAGVAQTQYIQVIAGVGSSKPEIDYILTSASDTLSVNVVGWMGVSNSAYPALV